MSEKKAGDVALPLLNRAPITYDSAINKDGNILNKLKYAAANEELYERLWAERRAIEALTKHHLGLGPRDEARCTVSPREDWLRGGFNACVPVEPAGTNKAGTRRRRRFLFRCPPPYKLSEVAYPGTMHEKLGCEVGTYAWMKDHCPDIRIPHLYGFGFSDSRHFTHMAQHPWHVRVIRTLKRLLFGLVGCPVSSAHVSAPATPSCSSAYMLLERIEQETGRVLVTTWNKNRDDPERRQRLFRGIACMILSRIPQPRIGSFQFHDDGTVSLTNRPPSSTIVLLENDGAPRMMPRGDTFACTEWYVSDFLAFHDRNFLSHPNAVFLEKICQGEMAVKAILRARAHRYIRRESRAGPFLPQLTDLHIGNIFVDDEWNVTCLIDLEWVCSMPAEAITVPYWLTGRGIDQLTREHLADFDRAWLEFMLAFEEEEHGEMSTSLGVPLSQIMRQTWESGGMWLWLSVDSVNAAYSLVSKHLMPRFTSRTSETREAISEFWCEESCVMVAKKMDDYRAGWRMRK
ncbi:hypothetical protein C8A05DRAFT_40528 [Staphylotrichum tortipilum]|uniref:Aminoglycoside phosphotransferase domain-containing protein n=1 Tax=Staphylotrichum tortipilum TaxID=2831512 RepID=A0AAN6RYC1_9PEZI|nr:hypothetical protein C8A05DRAFT_40528 [Staphylotrichum longicolle]